MRKNLVHIGIVEAISLPDNGLQSILAKIDTGADGSTVWASNIKQKSGSLSFVLFDSSSPYYNGEVVTTRDYQVTSVKNSFGQSEFRYKVPLRVRLGNRTIRAQFSLSDRSKNRYPILIGQRTLRGKFLVDVSRQSAKGSYRVLLLSVSPTPATHQLVKGLQSHGKKLQVTIARYQDLCFQMGGTTNRVTLITTGEDVALFDLVHFKTTARHLDIAASVAQYLRKRGVPFFDAAVANYPASSKLYQYIILADNDLSVPPSLLVLPERLATAYRRISSYVGTPFVLKDINTSKGRHNFLIRDKKAFDRFVRKTKGLPERFIAQSYIENEGDLRLLVLGSQVALVIKRQRASLTTHLNNTSAGGNATLLPISTLPGEVQQAAVKAAKLLQRQIAGVDMVTDKNTGLWYCLEVNDGPQLATGSFLTEKQAVLADYITRVAGK